METWKLIFQWITWSAVFLVAIGTIGKEILSAKIDKRDKLEIQEQQQKDRSATIKAEKERDEAIHNLKEMQEFYSAIDNPVKIIELFILFDSVYNFESLPQFYFNIDLHALDICYTINSADKYNRALNIISYSRRDPNFKTQSFHLKSARSPSKGVYADLLQNLQINKDTPKVRDFQSTIFEFVVDPALTKFITCIELKINDRTIVKKTPFVENWRDRNYPTSSGLKKLKEMVFLRDDGTYVSHEINLEKIK